MVAAVQPPPVPAKMAGDVGFDTRAAAWGAGLRGSAAQAGREVNSCGGEEGGCIRPRTRPVEQQSCLGTKPQAADRPSGEATY